LPHSIGCLSIHSLILTYPQADAQGESGEMSVCSVQNPARTPESTKSPQAIIPAGIPNDKAFSAWRTGARDGRPSDRIAIVLAPFFLDFTGFFEVAALGCPIP